MELDLVCRKVALIDEVIAFPCHIQVFELVVRVVIVSHRSGLGVKVIRINIQI